MSIGKNSIVIGNKIAYCPDNHAIIDLAALDLSSGPALLGPNGNTPYLLLLKADQIPQAVKILEEWEAKRTGLKLDRGDAKKPTCVADALGLKRPDEIQGDKP